MESIRILVIDTEAYTTDLLLRRLRAKNYKVSAQYAGVKDSLRLISEDAPYQVVFINMDPLLPQAAEILQCRNRLGVPTAVIILYDDPQPETFRFLIGNGANAFVRRSELNSVAELLRRYTHGLW